MNGEGLVSKQIGARGFYARVNVNCQNADEAMPAVALDSAADDSFQRSEGWIDAALAGAALGLKIAGTISQCRITRIDGMPCDTNPKLVAIAAVRAVWNALGFEPDEVLAGRLDAAVVLQSELTVSDLERFLGERGSCT